MKANMEAQVTTPTISEEDRYRQRTPKSRRFFAEAREYLPGGDSRSTLFHRPYPAVMDRGDGCQIIDIDGNELLDFTGNHSSLVHGYGHPEVMSAVKRQLGKGTCFPGSSLPQLEMSRLLCRRIPSLERVRFTNSGTEATMNAIRAARAFTGRTRIAKVEGGYHGTVDDVMISTHPSADEGGLQSRPRAAAGSKGLSPEAVGNVTVIPFNEAASARELIESQRDSLSAVLVEPVLGSAGMIPAEAEYLQTLSEVTRRLGILLILDEVVSLRVSFGGAQEHFGITPDLTILGKLIGGGFPLGAFGGRRDIMALFDPSQGSPAIPHPGSHNANPIGMVAGAATLELLTPKAIDELNTRGDYLRADMRRAFAEAGIPAQITGLGSLFAMHLTERPVRCYRDTLGTRTDLREQIFLGLYNEGILIDPRGVGNLSTALGEEEISRFSAALRAVLRRLGASVSFRM
jgi:glutamate-1-semialdehyde 2,1-aminomutase